MSLKQRVPVEQLDDERLTNIERKLVVAVADMRAPAGRAPRRILALAGVAMAITVAAVAGYKLRPESAPLVETPQTLAINTDTTNTVRFGDTVLTAGPHTDVVVERTRHRVVIDIHRGSLDLLVAHDPSRLLVVRAGDTEIEDVGTHFVVDYDGKQHVSVRVTEGEVRVRRSGRHEDITAGFAWTTSSGKLTIAALDRATSTTIAAVTPPADTTSPAIVASSPTAPTSPTSPATAASPPTSPTSPATVASSPTSPTAPATVASQPTSPTAPRVEPVPATSPTASRIEPAPATRPAAPSAAPAASPAASSRPTPRSNARSALDKLAIEEPLDVGTKDTATSISKYLELAVSMRETDDKTQVLYSIAVVQHRARQDKAALYTLSAVIKRQGGKAYRPALWLNVRIECMQRFDDECRQAADLYLRKVPDGVAAGVAQAILDEIARGP